MFLYIVFIETSDVFVYFVVNLYKFLFDFFGTDSGY